ncbi:MAG TPA: hypothetical protein VMK42_06050 [Anaeromyxobacteraceae bacterium]|nr:hypothetical protein [Anaeromyxobacteraceae bacterium]
MDPRAIVIEANAVNPLRFPAAVRVARALAPADRWRPEHPGVNTGTRMTRPTRLPEKT